MDSGQNVLAGGNKHFRLDIWQNLEVAALPPCFAVPD